MVEADSPTIIGASLLRFHPIEAALLLVRGLAPARENSKSLFVSGYSILAGLLKQNPRDYYKFMFEPCERSAVRSKSLSADHGIRDLLDLIKETRFGFTTVTDGNLWSLVGLSDLIQLYADGGIETDFLVKDVASPPISLPGGTSLKATIDKMFERRIRRVFVKETEALISDREIISFVFSPLRLKEARDSPSSMLEPKIEEAGPIDVEEVDDGMPVVDAARLMAQRPGITLLCGKGVITPWDLVMKPWNAGRLVVNEGSGSLK